MRKGFWFTLVSVVILLVIGILNLTACDPMVPNGNDATKVPTTQSGVYYFLAANNSDPFYVPGVKGFTEAGKAVGMKTEFVGPMEASTSEQMKTFEQLIANPDTKGIFWYAMDFNVGEPLVKEAVAKGISVVIGAADSPFKTRNAFIGYDNTILGQQAGQWVAKLTDCKGSVGTIAINGANLTERVAGFNAYLAKVCPDVKLVERASHDGSASSAAQTIDAYLVANPDLTLLWFADGGAGQQAGLWKEKQAAGVKTMFLATDMPPATLQAVKDGVFVGSVGQDTFTEEYFGVILLDQLHKGNRVPDTLYLSAILVDKTNVDQYIGK
jgi:simple sugar transport system substrate-binding protein